MLHTPVENPASHKPITLDVDGEPQGVLVATPEGYRFVAVRLEAFGVDGETFDSFESAQDAIRAAIQAAQSRP